jgi:hypothetical protein
MEARMISLLLLLLECNCWTMACWFVDRSFEDPKILFDACNLAQCSPLFSRSVVVVVVCVVGRLVRATLS